MALTYEVCDVLDMCVYRNVRVVRCVVVYCSVLQCVAVSCSGGLANDSSNTMKCVCASVCECVT